MRFVLFLAVICCAAGCRSLKKPVAKEVVVLDTLHVSALNNPYELYRATPERVWNIVDTRVSLGFDFRAKTASGKARVRLHPYFYPADSLVLDAKSMRLDDSVRISSPANTAYTCHLRGDKLTIRFAGKLQATDTVVVDISYTAMPYGNRSEGGVAISDSRGLYFINTDYAEPAKTALIWTQGEPESNSHWVPTIDHPNSRSAFRIELTVPDSFRTLSNGALISSVSAAGGKRTDIWEIRERIQVYAAMFAVGKFDVVQDQPWNGREVSYYVEPDYAPYASGMFRYTGEMMDFFSRFTGVPYPWNKYSQVVVRDFVAGAMENTTASLFGEFVAKNARELQDAGNEDIVAHELFHHWFGNLVTAESWSHLTLNESFANYGEYLWKRHKHGQGAAEVHLLAYRDRYLAAARLSDPPLVRFHYGRHGDMFDRISYQKGGKILHYLHALMGDTAFRRAMELYLRANAHNSAEAVHWRLAAEEASGKDWTWFFDQWYNRGGHPELDITYDYDDAAGLVTVTVIQQNADSGFRYRLPLQAALVYSDGKREIKDWDIRKRKEVFQYPYQGGNPPLVIPDLHSWLPGKIREHNKNEAAWVTQYRVSAPEEYAVKDRAFRAITSGEGVDRTEILRLALNDRLPALRTAGLKYLEGITDARGGWIEKVQRMAVSDTDNQVRAAAWDVLGTWKTTNETASLNRGLEDSSYLVAGAALWAWYKTEPEAALAHARKAFRRDPRGRQQEVIWEIFGLLGGAEEMDLLESDVARVNGRRKMLLGAAIVAIAARTGDRQLYERGTGLLVHMTEVENLRAVKLGLTELFVPLKGTVAFRNEFLAGRLKLLEEREIFPEVKERLKKLIADL